MTDTPKHIAIVGANLAGCYAADALRKRGYEGEIHLIGDEPDPPYERPPLSKEMLLRPEETPKTLFVHEAGYYAQQRIDLRTNARAVALDLRARRVRLADGTEVGSDRIILCTGGEMRRLNVPGADLGGIHYLRTLAHSRAIAAEFAPGKSAMVVGGGVIGLEIAASARMRGCEVTVLEAANGLMLRVVSPQVSQFLEQMQKSKGVVIRTGVVVTGFTGAGRVQAVELAGGERVAADVVIVGVGIDPAVQLAKDAGITCDNGVVIDEFCRTSAPEVLAAGDVANLFNVYLGRRGRLENVQAAQNLGAAAAATIMGATEPHIELPYWWSDQFEYSMQAAGETASADQAVLRGMIESGAFSVFYLTAGVITGILTVNQPKDIAVGRRMVMKRLSPNPAALADPGADLRQMLQVG